MTDKHESVSDLNKIINGQRERIAELEKENYQLTQQIHNTQWPEKCPITLRDFFMEIDGKPTYGDPYDSYTIPLMDGKPSEQFHERELYCSRYDHDEGCWVDDETIQLRIIHENVIWGYEEYAEAAEKRLVEVERERDDLETDLTALSISTGMNETWEKGRKLQQKRDIEQQIKALDELAEKSSRRDFFNNRYSQEYISTDVVNKKIEQLRQQLNGGE